MYSTKLALQPQDSSFKIRPLKTESKNGLLMSDSSVAIDRRALTPPSLSLSVFTPASVIQPNMPFADSIQEMHNFGNMMNTFTLEERIIYDNPKLNGFTPRKTFGGKDKPLVIIAGDSLSTEDGYGQYLRKNLGGKANVINLAEMDKQLRYIGTDSISKNYNPNRKDNIVILTAGTNDLRNGAKGEILFEKLKETAKTLKDKGFTVVVGTSIKVGGDTNVSETNQRLIYNNLIREYEDAPWHTVVDLGAKKEFDDRPGSKVTDNKKGIYSGNVHLTGKGYKIMAESFYDRIKSEL